MAIPPVHGSNPPVIRGNQADPAVIKAGSVKDKLAQLNARPGFPGNNNPAPAAPAAPRALPKAPVVTVSAPPSDLPPQLIPGSDGFIVQHNDGSQQFLASDGTPIAPSTPPKVQIDADNDDAKLALSLALAIEASTNSPAKIQNKFQVNKPKYDIDRSHEADDAALAAALAAMDDDLPPAKPSVSIPVVPGYKYNAESDFWFNDQGDIKFRDEVMQQAPPVKSMIDPMKVETNKLLANGYISMDGIYFNSQLDIWKTADDIEKDLIQEVNAAAKSEGYFFDPSTGKTGLQAIYRKNTGEFMHFAEVYEKFVNINFSM